MSYESRQILKCNLSDPLDFNNYITQNNKGEVINYILKLHKKSLFLFGVERITP